MHGVQAGVVGGGEDEAGEAFVGERGAWGCEFGYLCGFGSR